MARPYIKKFQIELNSADNLRDLLQEVIELADEQIVQIQDEINKLKNSSDLTELSMDEKTKYTKAVNDFLGMKDKAIAKKIEVSKILNEVMAHNGNLSEINEAAAKGSFNINAIQNMIDETMSKKESSEETRKIVLKKP